MLPDPAIETLAGALPAMTKGNSPLGDRPFNERARALLADLSRALMRDPNAKQQTDVVAFAFWCRKAEVSRLKSKYDDTQKRLGRGLAFHISPGNVPINAFYSFAFGLLAGNANIVRLPSKASTSTDIVLAALNDLFARDDYNELASSNVFIRYKSSSDVTRQISAICDARIIWGGDATIADIRKYPIPARAHEISFADRYSFAVLEADTVAGLSDADMQRLAVDFFNDTLQMDQNACSSPHLLIWEGSNSKGKERFWNALSAYTAKKYELEPTQSVDRYTRLLAGFIKGPDQQLLTELTDPIQRVQLKSLPSNIDQLRGIYGLFYEFDTDSLPEVAHIVNIKYQTLTYFGLENKNLAEFVITNRLNGVDRIVPIGAALDIDTIWDGHDVLRELSRIIDVR